MVNEYFIRFLGTALIGLSSNFERTKTKGFWERRILYVLFGIYKKILAYVFLPSQAHPGHLGYRGGVNKLAVLHRHYYYCDGVKCTAGA